MAKLIVRDGLGNILYRGKRVILELETDLLARMEQWEVGVGPDAIDLNRRLTFERYL